MDCPSSGDGAHVIVFVITVILLDIILLIESHLNT